MDQKLIKDNGTFEIIVLVIVIDEPPTSFSYQVPKKRIEITFPGIRFGFIEVSSDLLNGISGSKLSSL